MEANRMSGGRPGEGRVRKVLYVLPLTAEQIEFLVDKSTPDANTVGKVIDKQFGFPASKKVAGAGRTAPRGQNGK